MIFNQLSSFSLSSSPSTMSGLCPVFRALKGLICPYFDDSSVKKEKNFKSKVNASIILYIYIYIYIYIFRLAACLPLWISSCSWLSRSYKLLLQILTEITFSCRFPGKRENHMHIKILNNNSDIQKSSQSDFKQLGLKILLIFLLFRK